MVTKIVNGTPIEVTAFYVVRDGEVVAELSELRQYNNGVEQTIWEALQNYWLNNVAWRDDQEWKQ